MKYLFSIMLCVLLLSCCKPITEGDVYDKEFHPSWTQIVLMPITISNGKTSITTYHTMFVFHPDSWTVSFKKYDKEKNKWRSRTVWVSEAVYNNVSIGNYYKMTDMDLTEEPVEKREATKEEQQQIK